MSDKVLNSQPSPKGLSIRQYVLPESETQAVKNSDGTYSKTCNFASAIDTQIFLDGKRLDCVQGVAFQVSVDDIFTEVTMVMLTEQVDIDLANPSITLINDNTPEMNAEVNKVIREEEAYIKEHATVKEIRIKSDVEKLGDVIGILIRKIESMEVELKTIQRTLLEA